MVPAIARTTYAAARTCFLITINPAATAVATVMASVPNAWEIHTKGSSSPGAVSRHPSGIPAPPSRNLSPT